MLYFDVALQTIRKVKDRVIAFWDSLFPWSWLVVDHCENNPHNSHYLDICHARHTKGHRQLNVVRALN